MSTVSKEIADRIVAGEYQDDHPVQIVEYDNAWGGKGYGVTFFGRDPKVYLTPTDYVRNPRIYWQKGGVK